MPDSIITAARTDFHRELVNGPLSIRWVEKSDKKEINEWVASNADVSQPSSRKVALNIAQQLKAPKRKKGPGQTAGVQFEKAVRNFVDSTFTKLQSVRPGNWTVENLGNKRSVDHIARFHPYRHLEDLAYAIKEIPNLESILGNSYVVSPDVLVLREAVDDSTINSAGDVVVDDRSALMSPFRLENSRYVDSPQTPADKFVHAVISCKWTMRSDRAQNTRSEALNLIRNRKGRTPHIVAVTAEPSLSRISSLALGTGDIDLVYHAFLDELEFAVQEVGTDDAREMLHTLVEGNRLRDISDLPMDLAV
jgi:hypothetical protein